MNLARGHDTKTLIFCTCVGRCILFSKSLQVGNTHISFPFHSSREIMYYVYLEMAYKFQSNYTYTTKIRQICSGVIFVHIVLISCSLNSL